MKLRSKPRLQKFLAQLGVGARRKIEQLQKEGRVLVNSEILKEPGYRVDPEHDRIVVLDADYRPRWRVEQGSLKDLRKRRTVVQDRIYLMLNKPRGWVTTVSDPHHFQTVTRLLKLQERVYPVGRLDQSSEGLLILTNDGELTYRLTHPRFGVIRRYELVVKGRLTSEELRALAAGVELEDGRTRPVRTKVLEEANTTRIEVEIGEGKKRQLRRMFEHLGHPVISLKRTRFATLKLGRLKPGAYRALTPKEVKSLYRVVGLEED